MLGWTGLDWAGLGWAGLEGKVMWGYRPPAQTLGAATSPSPTREGSRNRLKYLQVPSNLTARHTLALSTLSAFLYMRQISLDKYSKPGNTSNCIKYVINRTETETDEIFTVAADIFKCHWGMLQLQSVSRYIHRAMDTKSDTIFGSVFSVYVFLGFIVWALMFLKWEGFLNILKGS